MLETNNESEVARNSQNEELWRVTGCEKINAQIRRRKWKWIGHTLRQPNGDIAKTALEPTISCRRTVVDEARAVEQ